jgi:hypothetical protein
MSRRACYIVTSFWAHGELHMALDLAVRQRAAGVEPIFVIPPSHVDQTRARGIAYETLIPGSGKLNAMLLGDVWRRLRPDTVILADFLNYAFCERHYGLTAGDLAVFDAPISAFDIYDFGASGGRVDTYGFRAKNLSEASVAGYHRLLQPVPVVPPEPSDGERIIRYPLFEELEPYTSAERDAAREALGFGPADRVVLVTSALWQHTHRPYRDVQPFLDACRRALDEILARLPATVVVVGAGGVGESVPGVRRYTTLPAADFDRLTAACDLYVGNNYISTSMARMVLRGVPTLLLSSSVVKHPDGRYSWPGRAGAALPAALETVPRVYPFRMFPVGWHAFLRPLVAGNDFYRVMRHAELFEPDACVELAAAMLRGGDADRSASARLGYLARLGKLPSAAEVVL